MPGVVGAAGRRRAVQERDRRDPGRAALREPLEHAPALRPHLDLVREEIGSGAFDEMDERQPEAEREVETLDQLEAAEGHHGAGVDAAVVDDDQAAHARHEADARDQRRTGHARLPVGIVDEEARQVEDLDERHPGIEETPETLARRQLPALLEARTGAARRGSRRAPRWRAAGRPARACRRDSAGTRPLKPTPWIRKPPSGLLRPSASDRGDCLEYRSVYMSQAQVARTPRP